MIYLKLLICLGVPLALGLAGLAALLRKKLACFNFGERIALALALGAWLLILLMFVLPFGKIPLDLNNLFAGALIVFLALLGLGFRSWKYYLPKQLPRPGCPLAWLLLGLIIIKILLVCWSAWIQPVIGPDLLEYYALAAKHTYIFKRK